MKEYSLNHVGVLIVAKGMFLHQGLLEALGTKTTGIAAASATYTRAIGGSSNYQKGSAKVSRQEQRQEQQQEQRQEQRQEKRQEKRQEQWQEQRHKQRRPPATKQQDCFANGHVEIVLSWGAGRSVRKSYPSSCVNCR